MSQLLIAGPYRSRKASQSLREQLVGYLQGGETSVGSPFFSDTHLVRLSGLSRQTVRRALDSLHREGWIVRQPGRGSFVGPRAAAPVGVLASRTSREPRGVVRMAVVLMYGMASTAPDWYSQSILAGIDEAAVAHGVSIELIGCDPGDAAQMCRRLAQSQPNVLVVMSASTRHVVALAEARRQNVPCLLTGTRLLGMGVPAVCEDGFQGAKLAVQYLVERGHRRIGALFRTDPAPWVFHRREGYFAGLTEAGIEHDERLSLWVGLGEEEIVDEYADRLQRMIDTQTPTALLLTSAWHTHLIARLIERGRLSVPRDLSLVTFDRHTTMYQQLFGFEPTIVELPLKEMGRRLAAMAREVHEGRPVEQRTNLPCRIVEGGSVLPLRQTA